MTDRQTPGVGETFGDYTIEALLGRGGMGTVYLATHERLARRVALKVIASELALEAGFRARFLRESQLAASLDHPNVIPIYDADEVDGVLYLAMRYVDGPTVQSLIRERAPLSPTETRRLAEQIGGALDAAHRAGLVHRDVKPANILVAESGKHAYLCDFGLAKLTSSKGATHTGSFFGTVDYCAPEQIQGEPVDGRADVYSLGCVLYHCLTGEAPFVRDTDFAVLQAHLSDPPPALSSVRPDLPNSVDEVIARTLAKAPEDRFTTAGGLAESLGRGLGGAKPAGDDATRMVRPVETRVAPRPRRLTRRRVLWAAVGLLLIALAATVAAIVATRGSGGQSAGDARLRPFVDRIENVLAQSAEGRREIAVALTGGLRCTIPSRVAGGRIESVADNRQSILQQLGSMAAPTGEADEVLTLLQQALQRSIEADRHYRDGFAEAGTRCAKSTDPSFRLAGRLDAQATAAKRRFVAAFDPLAARFHRRAWTAEEI
ncbi:MAG TPA: serine/threonine-protein kinase [Gaiellaceae bacterium]|nr:serine/threonine-protein kinase [Gaiellaceae bacterium]